VLAVLVALLTGWHALLLPGGLIQRNTAPPDMTGKIYGLRDVWVEADGTWTILREGYLDRMRTYRIPPSGVLWRDQEKIEYFSAVDVSGIAHGSNKLMARGSLLDVKASKRYWELLRRLRPGGSPPPDRTEVDTSEASDASAELASEAYTLPSYADNASTDAKVAEDAQAQMGAIDEKAAVVVKTRGGLLEQSTRVLEGHNYYPSMDSYAFIDPDLWLTTDGQRYLHRVHASDTSGQVEISALLSVELEPDKRIAKDCVIGLDPSQGALFLLRANGERSWFEAETLAPLRDNRLPGVWEQEYATFGPGTFEYTHDQGVPLSRSDFMLMMRVLMVVFLASLLVLAYEGRRAWKYTSAVTTGATGSSSKSSST
jgi:hypothetical protein